MQNTSPTWKSLFASGAALQARAIVDGVVYTDVGVPVIERATMQDRMAVGNVVSASLALALRGTVNLSRSAAVVIEIRLSDGQAASEWLPQGTFYISRRMRDPVSGVLALECYDALLKANAIWTPSAGEWPRTMAAVTAELAALLGVDLDSRTVIPTGAAYAMGEPAEGTTIRRALSIIAQAAGGNWIMTPAGRLRLVRLGEAGDAVDVAGVLGGIDVGQAGTVTGVRSSVDGAVTLAGDDTGIVVDVTLAPVIAAELAERLIGQAYTPFHLTGAVYDPAAELGDAVRAGVNGEVASVLCSEQAAYGPAFRGEIAAPDPGEVTDEYPYIGSADRTLALAKAAATEAVDRLDDDLTQQEIFNRLTDNGAAQGMVLYDGQLYINANYINVGFLNVDRINFNEPDSYYNVPNESDPDSLLDGQTIADGWIVNTSGTGAITVFYCGFAIPLRGKTVTVTFTFNDTLNGGVDTSKSIGNKADETINSHPWVTPSGRVLPNPYTYTVVVPNDAMSFSIGMNCAGVKQIGVSLSSPVTPSESIVYNYEGQRIGEDTKFQVYRDGTLITLAKSIFNNATRISKLYLVNPLDVTDGGTGKNLNASPSLLVNLGDDTADDVFQASPRPGVTGVLDTTHGGTGADTPAAARSSLGITPANIGAVKKSGDTMAGNLVVEKAGDTLVQASNSTNGMKVSLEAGATFHGIWSHGYKNGSQDIAGKWMIYRDASGNVIVNGRALENVAKAGDAMTGNLVVEKADGAYVRVRNTTNDAKVSIEVVGSGIHGLYSNGYYDGTDYVSSGKWMIYRDAGGNVIVNGNAANVAGTVDTTHGGTGKNLNGSPSLLVNLEDDTADDVFQASPRPGVTGVLDTNHGGTGENLKASPSLLVDLEDDTADDVFQASPRPGVTGVLDTNHGGTGENLKASPSLLVNLGDNTADDVFQASPRPGVTGVLDTTHGGTGADTPAAARSSLGITPANIGAVKKSGDTMTGNLIVEKAGDAYAQAYNSANGVRVSLEASGSTNHGIYSNGYHNGTAHVSSGKWMIYRDASGSVIVNGKASENVAKAGDTMTGNLIVEKAGGAYAQAYNSANGMKVSLEAGTTFHGIWSNGYYNGTNYVSSGKWMIYRDASGNVIVNGRASENVAKAGDTMTGNLIVEKAGGAYLRVRNATNDAKVSIEVSSTGNHGLWSNGYYNGTNYVSSGKWLINRSTDGDVYSDGRTVGTYLKLTSATYSVLLGQLQSLKTGETCGLYMTGSAAGLLSRVGDATTGKLSGTHTGVVTRTDTNTYRFITRAGAGGKLYSWVLTTGTSSATTDAVYRFEGTAI